MYTGVPFLWPKIQSKVPEHTVYIVSYVRIPILSIFDKDKKFDSKKLNALISDIFLFPETKMVTKTTDEWDTKKLNAFLTYLVLFSRKEKGKQKTTGERDETKIRCISNIFILFFPGNKKVVL